MYVVSQNIDNLHLRSGIPRKSLAELHGDCFAERCPRCKQEYIRDFEVQTVWPSLSVNEVFAWRRKKNEVPGLLASTGD